MMWPLSGTKAWVVLLTTHTANGPYEAFGRITIGNFGTTVVILLLNNCNGGATQGINDGHGKADVCSLCQRL